MSIAAEGHGTILLLFSAPPDKAQEDEGISNLETCYIASRDVQALKQTLQRIRKQYGPIDVLINHVSLAGFGTLEMLGEEEMKTIYEETFWNTVRLYKEIIPYMRLQQDGLIVNLLYSTRECIIPPLLAYEAAKAGIVALSDSTRYENRKTGLEIVNAYAGKVPSQLSFNPTAHCECDDLEKSHMAELQCKMQEYAIKLSISKENDSLDMTGMSKKLIELLQTTPGTRPDNLSLNNNNNMHTSLSCE